jgi:hypothetical protein
MREVPEHVRHRVEAERLSRLADLSADQALVRMLLRLAEQHRKIAEQLEASRDDHTSRQRASRPGGGQPAERVYQLLLMKQGHPDLLQMIEAEADIAALHVAYFVHDACSDVYTEFELWQGVRLIVRSRDGRGVKRRPMPRVEQLNSKMQECLVRIEEALLNSRHAVAESRRLMEATARLRALTGRTQPVGRAQQRDAEAKDSAAE